MLCVKCGKEIADDAFFCPFCGQKTANGLSSAELYDCGYYHYVGTNGYPQDYKKAYYYFRQAANLGELEAMNYLGLMFWDGLGVPANIQTAIGCFQHALKVNPNFGRAHYNLGRIYYTGAAGKVDYDQAYEHFMKAIEFGKGEAHYGWACHFVGYIWMGVRNQWAKSVPYCMEAVKADPSISEAWFNLGSLRWQGHIEGELDPSFYYGKAANLGYTPAYCELGMWYMQRYILTRGDSEMKRLAFFWFDKAVAAGDKRAKHWRTILWACKDDWRRMLQEGKKAFPDSTPTPPNGGSRSCSTPREDSTEREFCFRDSRGNLVVSGGMFYDFKGVLRNWGDMFYDSRGNLIKPGGCFYDGKGYYCEWGRPFHDAQGNYICP